MKYYPAKLIGNDPSESDALGNPITALKTVGTTLVRATEWTADDVSLLGREITSSERKVLTRAPTDQINESVYLELSGIRYKITSVKDLGRWRSVYLKVTKI